MSSTISILVAAAPSSDSRTLTEQIESEFTTFIRQAADLPSLYRNLQEDCPDILIVDTASARFEKGVDLVRKLRIDHPALLILPLIPADRRELIQQMLSLDVFLYIHTPIEPAETTLALTRATEHLALQPKTGNTREQSHPDFHGMIGSSAPMQKLFDLIARVAEDDDTTVLIRGESGTGKEMVAKAIHAQSARNTKNFVAVNCAAIPDDLLESELFGYTKGAFTGAVSNKIGRIQYADGGTLFLDEIGDMKPSLQAKLLRVLQEKEFEPVGALKPIPVDTRVLAATHCDLEQLVSEGIFREDLYYRLSVIPLSIPPLKDRREDIPLLITKFIQSFSKKRNREPFVFSKAAAIALENFEWRGNVRELENLIQHMSILYGGRQVEFDDLPEKFLEMRQLVEKSLEPLQMISVENDEHPPTEITHQSVSTIPWNEGPVDFRELINSFETELIVHAMKLTGGNKKEAARMLNLKRTTLLEKIKKKELNSLWEE
jgi:DNA-binding NtrC family response regulator